MSDPAGVPTAVVLGAAGAGMALHLTALGVPTSLMALPGDDEQDLGSLERAGVAVSRHSSATSAQQVPAGAVTGAVTGAEVVLVALTASGRDALPPLRSAGSRLWVDLSDWDGAPSALHDPFIEAGSHLFLSDAELADPLRTAEQLLPGKELVVITHGKRGATAFFPDTQPFFVLPHDAGPVVDTLGARDAFCSGTAYGFVQGWDWPRALRAGSVLAGGRVATAGPVQPELTADWLSGCLGQQG